jgi:hypothetical protein
MDKFPIKIEKMVFDKSSFSGKYGEYKYTDIVSIKFLREVISINFSKNEFNNLSIRTSDNKIHELLRKSPKVDKGNIVKIFNYLNELTFSKRLNIYINSMEKNGYIDYKFFVLKMGGLLGDREKTAKIYNNGNIVLDNKMYNLKKAYKFGTLKIGVARGIGCDTSSNPYEILIHEKKLLLGSTERPGSMVIDGSWDHPIVSSIIKNIAEDKAPFQ